MQPGAAVSVADFGSMEALVAAAQKEGQLNVIALPPDWANYGEIIKAFEAKYKIKVNSENPDASSSDEIAAVKSRKGQKRAPDVMDLGIAFARSGAAENLFAPYKVTAWDKIPASTRRTPTAAGTTTTAATSPSAATPRRSPPARRPSPTC